MKRKLTDEEQEMKRRREARAIKAKYAAIWDGVKARVAAKKEKRPKSKATMGLIAINPERRGKVA